MQNVVFTQLSIPELRQLLREEVQQALAEKSSEQVNANQQTIFISMGINWIS